MADGEEVRKEHLEGEEGCMKGLESWTIQEDSVRNTQVHTKDKMSI